MIILIRNLMKLLRKQEVKFAYLLWKTRATYYESYFFVKNRRMFIAPNDGFVTQLQIFEKLLKENDYNLNKINLHKIIWPQ